MRIFAALFFAAVFQAAAQSPQVPHKMEFAGITLTIRDDARREIQKDVDALTQSPRHFNIKAERARTYFPIIEKIFQEEQVPEDFKYLALQESALIADAVSVSNAVGFWQFKDFTAMEMGLRVDKEIDERMNIVASSRAAARYIKKNNTFFNNWIYALQAYQMGAGGVLKSVKQSESGVTHMEINSETYWYVKRYLAHKIAYEEGVSGIAQTQLLPYYASTGKSLTDLAREVTVDETELKNYNKWVRSGLIPSDRTYVVLIPLAGNRKEIELIAGKNSKSEVLTAVTPGDLLVSARKKINGIHSIQALAGDDPVKLASRAEVDLVKFLKWNDLSSGEKLIAGEFYYLAKKHSRAAENFHKVKQGESLWSVSQRYGVRLKRLQKYNRLHSAEITPGMMLWLASMRPRTVEVLTPVENPVNVSNDESFSWTLNPGAATEKNDTVTLPSESANAGVVLMEKPLDSLKTLQELAIESPNAYDSSGLDAAEKTQLTKTIHTVQAGETLYAIAKMYNLGVMDLVNWNKLDLQEGIKPGQMLKLSQDQVIREEINTAKTVRDLIHEVKSSDTLYGIARQYGVTIKELMDWNEKKDFSLAVGEKLKIHQSQ